MPRIPCSLCGTLMDTRGIKTHTRSDRCNVARDKKIAREQNLVRVSNWFPSQYTLLGTKRRGVRDRYAPADLVELYNLLNKLRINETNRNLILRASEASPAVLAIYLAKYREQEPRRTFVDNVTLSIGYLLKGAQGFPDAERYIPGLRAQTALWLETIERVREQEEWND